MLELYMVDTGWGVPFASAAPFPLKLETWLRMAEIPYRVVIDWNPGNGPKGKTPWIVDGALRMGDSELIIEHLAGKHGIDIDAHLTPVERATGLAIRRMFEEHYHQAFEYHVLLGEGGETRLAESIAPLPLLVRLLGPTFIKTQTRKQLYARGLGRHDPQTILAMGRADLDAASALLGDKPYFLGDQPSLVDATALGFLGVSVYVSGNNPLFNYAASLTNLMQYCERMRTRYFPDTYQP